MQLDSPIVVAMALDQDANQVADAATQLARRLQRQIVPVHAQSDAQNGDEARARIIACFGQALDEGIVVAEPVIRAAKAAELILETAARTGAHLIVAGPGRPSTVVQWFLGSTAYAIVRNARQPVYLARGTVPGRIGRLIACPIDLSPHSRLGLAAALRMARVFESDLRIVHVVSADHSVRIGAKKLAANADRVVAAENGIRQMLDAHDTNGIDVEIAVVAGRPSVAIVELCLDAQLVVLASRSFRWLLPGTFGSTTEKVLRGVRCSVLAVRDLDDDREIREATLQRIARLRAEARACLDDDPVQAVELTRLACLYAPMNAALHELLAEAYAKLGLHNNASDAKQLAARIRNDFVS